jgi:hypothetical protein
VALGSSSLALAIPSACVSVTALGLSDEHGSAAQAVVHFRKKKTVVPETAVALGELILAAQRAVQARSRLIDQ